MAETIKADMSTRVALKIQDKILKVQARIREKIPLGPFNFERKSDAPAN